jgi:DNA-binding MarR family transcriptional regulator
MDDMSTYIRQTTYTPTMTTSPRWLTEDEQRAWRNFSLMQLQLFALLGRELTACGLSYPDYLVLANLSDRIDDQARMVELGHDLGWEKSRVSHHITRMEQRGLVERTRCPTDQRGFFVTMTDTGRTAIAAAAPDHVAVVRRHFIDLLSPEQLDTLDAIAQTVLDHLPDE